MGRATLITTLVAIVIIAVLAILLAFAKTDLRTAESDKRVLENDNALQGQVIATQAFSINRFNKVAELAWRANAMVAANSENKVIKYREILRREKTCDLLVPANISGRLLKYANSLRASAMHTDPGLVDSANTGAIATDSLTYCQAVLWIDPLLAAIDQANNQLGSIRGINLERKSK